MTTPQGPPPNQPYGAMPPPPPQEPGGPSDYVTLPGVGSVRVASIGQRFLGRLIDVLIVGVPGVILMFVILATGDASDAESASFAVRLYTVLGLFFVLGLLYEVGLIATRGATLGKQVAGVKVLRVDGQLPGWGPSVLRWIVPTVANFVCGLLTLIVYLSPLFDSSGRRQGWHDKVAKTIVISTK